MMIAADLQKYPANYVLSHRYEYQRFNKASINNVLSQLTIDNARVLYIDKGQETDTVMRFFNGKYKLESIAESTESSWKQATQNIQLKLPRANTLMPENFELVTTQHTQKPVNLINEERLNLYLGHSKHFKQPKGHFYINLNTGFADQSPRHSVMSEILTKGLTQSLVTLANEAIGGGMWLQLEKRSGMTLSTGGFTDKQQQLLETAFQQILSYEMSEIELQNLKASYISDIESEKQQILQSQLFAQFNKLMYLDEYSNDSLLAEVHKISVKDISNFKDNLLKNSKVNAFAFGNYSDETAQKMARSIEKQLPKERKISENYYRKALIIKEGDVLNWQQDSQMTDIAFADTMFMPYDVNHHATAKVLNTIMSPALFNQLRTEEQLAYSVGFFNSPSKEQLMMGFYIQSPAKGVAAVAERIESFKTSFSKKVLAKTEEEIEKIKTSELVSLTEPPKNIAEEAYVYLRDWRQQKLDFNSRSELITAMKQVQQADVTKLYSELLTGDNFGRLVLQMRGTKFESEPFAAFDKAKEVQDINALHETYSNKL